MRPAPVSVVERGRESRPGPPAPGPSLHRPVDRIALLRYPSATTLLFLLLVALLTVTSTMAGVVLHAGLAEAPAPHTPWPWLVVPAVLTLTGWVALTLGWASWLQRRRGLVPVDPAVGGPAQQRLESLAAEAGVPAPVLMWRPDAVTANAVTFGRPHAYRVAVGAALLGAARRRRWAFDVALRHELAHIRRRDVLLAYGALGSLYAAAAVLAVPVATLAWHAQWGMLASYVVRVAALAALVVLTRAALLRAREVDADLVAACSPDGAEPVARALEGGHLVAPAGGAHPTGVPAFLTGSLALHPTPAQRAATVRSPELAGSPSAWGAVVAGVVAGAAAPVLVDLAYDVGVPALTAEVVGVGLAFAALGGYAGLSLARAAGAGRLTPAYLVAIPALVAAGALAGVAVTPARAGLASLALGSDLLVMVLVLALGVCPTVALVGAHLRSSTPQPGWRTGASALGVAAGTGVAAVALLPLSRAVVEVGVPGGVAASWVTLPGRDPVVVLWAGSLALWAAYRAVSGPALRDAGAPGLLVGVVAGAVAFGWMVALWLLLPSSRSDEAAVRHHAACIVLAALTAVVAAVVTGSPGRNLPAAPLAAAAATAAGVVGVVVTSPSSSGWLALGEHAVVSVLGLGVVVGVPAVALAVTVAEGWSWGWGAGATARGATTRGATTRGATARGATARGARQGWLLRTALAAALTLTLGAVLTPVALGYVRAAPPERTLSQYVAEDWPQIAFWRQQALRVRGEIATVPSFRDTLTPTALSAFDAARQRAELVDGDRDVTWLNDAAVEMIAGEREAFVAELAALDQPDAAHVEERDAAIEQAVEAERAFTATWDAMGLPAWQVPRG
ncbi:MAG TPA: M48 family metalloprotease [Dermatophilaceae bacterium]|nr:M48 family metalloprotease [Dermatophilaceae bacterium]